MEDLFLIYKSIIIVFFVHVSSPKPWQSVENLIMIEKESASLFKADAEVK